MRRLWLLILPIAILVGLSGCARGDEIATPPALPHSGQRLHLERGLLEGEQGREGEPYYIETASGALIPAPEQPGTRFLVAVGADGVTLVQVRQGTVWVWANDVWVSLADGQQTRIWPGRAPETPSGVSAYLDRVTYLANPRLGE